MPFVPILYMLSRLFIDVFVLFVCIMATIKLETDKFDGRGDFSMWKRKMKVSLVQNKVTYAICSHDKYRES